MSRTLLCPGCGTTLPAPSDSTVASVCCPACGSVLNLSGEGPEEVILPAGSRTPASTQLAASLECLDNVQFFETGGVADTVGGVLARYRESFRVVPLRVPRPDHGVLDLSCTCPICEQEILLRSSSWLHTNRLVLLGMAVLGLILGVIGVFQIESAGMVAAILTGAGGVLILLALLLLVVRPAFADSLNLALQIREDAPRDPALWVMKGEDLKTRNYKELAGRGRNQHKIEQVRVVRPG